MSHPPHEVDFRSARGTPGMTPRPLCVELFSGTFGWSHGWLELGGQSIGFDIEHLPHHGPVPKGAELVLQDVRTLHGSQFRDADLILASPPCQEFSYRAMPWKRAKALGPPELGMELFNACWRIQREAIAAAGHHIPMVIENVRGAQKYVGRAAWHYGSYYLWGDVPALMPFVTHKPKFILDDIKNGQRRQVDGIYAEGVKVGGFTWSDFGKPDYVGQAFNGTAAKLAHQERGGVAEEGLKCGGDWFGPGVKSTMRQHSSKSPARKAASALIARIPERLSRHLAEVYWPPTLEKRGLADG